MMLNLTIFDLDEIVRLLLFHFRVPEGKVISSHPTGVWGLSWEETYTLFERGGKKILYRPHLLCAHEDWGEMNG